MMNQSAPKTRDSQPVGGCTARSRRHVDHFSALEYATKYATKQESRLEFTTRTGVEDTDGFAETVRSA